MGLQGQIKRKHDCGGIAQEGKSRQDESARHQAVRHPGRAMALRVLAVPDPPHASMPHVHDPSKCNAIPSGTKKALASQAVPSYPHVGQESAWRQIVLVVDILSVGAAHASIRPMSRRFTSSTSSKYVSVAPAR